MAAAIRLLRIAAYVLGGLVITGLAVAPGVPPAIKVVIVSLPFLFMLVRKPVLRRLAIGHISRRPRETALVILGSLLGTAIMTGSLVVGDTLATSIERVAFTRLGPIDETVTVGDIDARNRAEASLRAGLAKSRVDGILALTVASVTVSTVGEDIEAVPNASLLEVDFRAARDFGGDPATTGITGETPGEGRVVVGEDLADQLELSTGDQIDIHSYGTKLTLTIDRLVPRLGVAGFGAGGGGFGPAGGGSAANTVLAAPGTAARLAAAGTIKAAPPTQIVAVSNTGDVKGGASLSSEVADDIVAALGGQPANVSTAKSTILREAKLSGDQFTQLFGIIGFFAVIAGVLLLVNIFVMLASERQSELGMLRAVGLRRSGLVGSFSLEGWMYALASAALGTIAGLGVGKVITVVAAGVFSEGGGGQGGLDLGYSATAASIGSGFLLGFLISVVTVTSTSIWIARVNVIRAIRELPPDATRRPRLWTVVLGAFFFAIGGLVTVGSIARAAAVGVLVGPVFLAFGAILLLRRFVPVRPVVTASFGGLLAWEILVFGLFPRAFRDTEIVVFGVQGILLVMAGVGLLAYNLELAGSAVRFVGGGTRNMSLRLGLAYPLARRFRTALTLGTYSLVMYMLVTITIFSHLFGSQVERFTETISGGYDLVVESSPTNPVAADKLRAVPGVAAAAGVAQVTGEWQSRLSNGFVDWPAAAFDEAYIADRSPSLTQRPKQYATDTDAYRAVLADPNLFIPTAFFLQRGGGGPPQQVRPGEKVTLRDPRTGTSRELTVAAVAESGFGNLRPLMSYEALRSVFGETVVANVYSVRARDIDPSRLADRINGEFLTNGVFAYSFAEVVATNLAGQQRFFSLMRGYLSLGLVVGIAGLGVVMVRSVRERRREVGVLRSLGFSPVAVRRAFVAESAFVAVLGVGLGTVLAVITTWRLTQNADFGATLAFSIPWVGLGVVVAGTIAASLLATATPAQQASRIRPAVALRIAD